MDLDEGCREGTAVKNSAAKQPLLECVEISLLGLKKHLATSMGHSTQASVKEATNSLLSTSQTVAAAKLQAFTTNYDYDLEDANVCDTSRADH